MSLSHFVILIIPRSVFDEYFLSINHLLSPLVWKQVHKSPPWLPSAGGRGISSDQSRPPDLLREAGGQENTPLHHRTGNTSQTGGHRGGVVLTFLALQLWWDLETRKLSANLNNFRCFTNSDCIDTCGCRIVCLSSTNINMGQNVQVKILYLIDK